MYRCHDIVMSVPSLQGGVKLLEEDLSELTGFVAQSRSELELTCGFVQADDAAHGDCVREFGVNWTM